ncbi:MFS transporter [Phaeodactylibacter luteus]|uniref:MFS transporter n=2 Tax=Phaeodactylibacter luteus TaxID=1564516 RepID=A0A5C6RHS4_9BACT|nr:MFS transporter [Phaeodactylibacter luteus]
MPATAPVNEKLLLFLLAVVQFTHIIDFMIIMPLGKQFMQLFDITPQQFSVIVSSYALSAFAVGFFGAMFIDRFDRKKALLFTYLGFTLGTFACGLTENYYLFLAARSITGAFGGLLSALVLAIIGDTIPLKRRGQAMGFVMTAFSAASVVGVPAGLYLAATFNWRAPFLTIGAIAAIFVVLIAVFLPKLNSHLRGSNIQRNPVKIMGNIFRDSNQRAALLFTTILMLGHFTIIPFIAPYMQLNIGFSDHEVTYIYAVGGTLTVFLLPFFGRLADRFGHARVFTLASVGALASIFAITNLNTTSMAIALCATSSFFVVASGRNVPATTMVTSVVRPESRGSFMSVRTSVNQMAMGLASFMAGLIVTANPDGSLSNYQYAGYIAIGMSLLAVVLAWRLKLVE